MDRGAWRATVHRVAKSRTRPKQHSTQANTTKFEFKYINVLLNFFKKQFTSKKPAAAAAAKSLQSCPTLCDPIDGSPPGSPIPGSLQARTLEGIAISFSKKHLSVREIREERPTQMGGARNM